MGISPEDFSAKGGDGQGPKTCVPWTRFGSHEHAPSTTNGFYVVYLWALDGSAVYLSLNQGTTDFKEGNPVRKPHAVLESRVRWARETLKTWLSSRTGIAPLVLKDKGEGSLGRGYELGNIASVRYELGSVPSEEQLLWDAMDFATALGKLYAAQSKAPIPYEIPELDDAEEAAAVAAGKQPPIRGAGFRQSKEERYLIEQHAVAVAQAYFAADGWNVKLVGAPFDLELRRGTEYRTVEVKGTTSTGEKIVVTEGEVRHHEKVHPNNALVVVRSIVLDRSTTPPTARGGVLYQLQPWNIDRQKDLIAISHRYEVPGELYAAGGLAADDVMATHNTKKVV